MNLTVDLTPWFRGPLSGVGLTALHSAKALSLALEGDHSLKLRLVRRDQRLSPRLRDQLSIETTWLNPFHRWIGASNEIFHSFALSISDLRYSRTVLTVHDCWTLWPNRWQDRRFQMLQAKKLAKALKRADRLITPTEGVRGKLSEWDKSLIEKTFVVPWAPTLEFQDGTGGEGLSSSVRDYLRDGRPYILMVASLETRKNHRLLFEAIRGIRDIDLVLAGAPGFGAEAIEKELSELSTHMRVLRFRELNALSLMALYDGAFIMVSTSWDEGFGLPVVEAMSRAKPLVLSRIPAHQEVAGNAALYFDPENGAGELRGYLEALIKDANLREDLSRRSLKRASHFSWDKTAEKLISVYRGLG